MLRAAGAYLFSSRATEASSSESDPELDPEPEQPETVIIMSDSAPTTATAAAPEAVAKTTTTTKTKSRTKTKPTKRTAGKSLPGGRRALQKAAVSHAKVMASSTNDAPAKKKRRVKPGVKAVREIRKYQKSTDMLIPRAPMIRLIKGILTDLEHDDIRLTKGAVKAIHEMAEVKLAEHFTLLTSLSVHRGGVTIALKDAALAKKLTRSLR